MKSHLLRSKIIAGILLLMGTLQVQAQQTESLTLEKTIQAALLNNNLIHIRELQVKENEAKVKEAHIKKYPVVTLSSAYQYNANTGSLTIPAGALGELPLGGTNILLPGQNLDFELGKHNVFNAGVSAYQPITQLGKIGTSIKLAEADRSIASLEHTKARLQITNAVEQLYYGILAVRKRKVEYQKNIEVAQMKLYDVESALLGGKTIEANKAGFQANIANEEQVLLKLKFQEEDYVAELRKLTGITAEELVLEEENELIHSPRNLTDYHSEAEKSNIDIQLTQLQKEKSELRIKAVKQANLPELGIIGGYSYQEGNNIFPQNNPYIGASLKWNIQDLFSNKQLINQRKLAQQQAEENELYLKKQTSVAVEKAYRKMKQAEELITVAEKAVYYRQQELKVENDKRNAGLNKPISVLEIEAELAKSQADLYGAKQSYMIALSELTMLTGNK